MNDTPPSAEAAPGDLSMFGDGRMLNPMLERAARLTRHDLLNLAAWYDDQGSMRLRRPVAEDIRLGWEWALFPRVFSLYRQVAAARHGVDQEVAAAAWQATADAVTARLFAGALTPDAVSELEAAWDRLPAAR